MLRTQTSHAFYAPGYGWSSTIGPLDPYSAFVLVPRQTFDFAVTASDAPWSLAVEAGYNIFSVPAEIDVAHLVLSNPASRLAERDRIEDESGNVALYIAEVDMWFGELRGLTPGIGYRIRVVNDGTIQLSP
jgi:hypothetical protein